jgi:hypothetical protein
MHADRLRGGELLDIREVSGAQIRNPRECGVRGPDRALDSRKQAIYQDGESSCKPSDRPRYVEIVETLPPMTFHFDPLMRQVVSPGKLVQEDAQEGRRWAAGESSRDGGSYSLKLLRAQPNQTV